MTAPAPPVVSGGLSIVQVLLEDVQFASHPDALAIPANKPPQPGNAEITLEFVKAGVQVNDKDVVMVRVRVQCNDAGAAYNYNVRYLIVLTYDGPIDSEEIRRRIVITGGQMVFPFVRELIANLTSRGRFGPTWIGPVNFSAGIAPVQEPASGE